MNSTGVLVALLVAVVAAARGTWSPCGLSMVSAINPVAERSRGNRYGLTAAWYVSGAVAGGATLGAGAALGSWLATPLRGAGSGAAFGGAASGAAALAVAACLVTVAADVRLGGFALPMHPRQVNELWLGRYRRWIYAAGFGFQIGTGLATYVMTSAVYLTVALAVLTCSPGWAFAVGVAFGLVRGLEVLLTARARHPAALYTLHRRLAAAERWSARTATYVQAAAAVLLAATAWGTPGGAVTLAAACALVGAGAARHALRRVARVG